MLDIQKLAACRFVASVEYHQELGSTSDRAIECVRDAQVPLPLLIVAERQTAGRGRGGHRWWTGEQSLAFTLLLPEDFLPSPPGGVSLLGLTAALAVVEAVAPRLSGQRLGICWPNDVRAAGRKLAGILVEVLADRRQALGIGLNVNDHMAEAPIEIRHLATSLRDLTRCEHDRTAVLLDVLSCLEALLPDLRTNPAEIGRRAAALCEQTDNPLTLELGGQLITGICRGIAPDGALLLETAAGVSRFYSGTVRRA